MRPVKGCGTDPSDFLNAWHAPSAVKPNSGFQFAGNEHEGLSEFGLRGLGRSSSSDDNIRDSAQIRGMAASAISLSPKAGMSVSMCIV